MKMARVIKNRCKGILAVQMTETGTEQYTSITLGWLTEEESLSRKRTEPYTTTPTRYEYDLAGRLFRERSSEYDDPYRRTFNIGYNKLYILL